MQTFSDMSNKIPPFLVKAVVKLFTLQANAKNVGK